MSAILEEVNWKAVAISGIGTLICHQLAPYVYRRLWRNYLCEYNELNARDRMDFNERLGTTVLGLVCTSIAGFAFLRDGKLRTLGLVGSTSLGKVALGITIGQFAADMFHSVVICGCKPKRSDVIHHGASVLGAFLAHRYFHTFALYRYIHELTLLLVGIFAQMHMVNFDTKRPAYFWVSTANLIVFTALRLVVIPFHCSWMMWTSLNAPDRSAVPLLMWPVAILLHLLVDYVNVKWAMRIVQIYNKVRRRSRK